MIPARRGQNLLDFLTTDWYNQSGKTKRNRPTHNTIQTAPHHDWIDCIMHGDETEDIAWLEPGIIMDGHLLPGSDPDDVTKLTIVAQLRKPTENNIRDDNWGIALGHLTPGVPGRMCVAGVTWAKFERTDPNHEYVYLDTVDLKLKSSDGGSSRIISHSVTTGTEGYGLIRLGAGVASAKIFWVASGITARASGSFPTADLTMGTGVGDLCKVVTSAGTVKIKWTAGERNLYNMDPRAIPAGSFCRAVPIDGYYVVEAVMKSVRVNNLDLELTVSSEYSTWVPWHTGAECPPP
jgi:3D (Asp-Asp-Asp) domain-containing protein